MGLYEAAYKTPYHKMMLAIIAKRGQKKELLSLELEEEMPIPIFAVNLQEFKELLYSTGTFETITLGFGLLGKVKDGIGRTELEKALTTLAKNENYAKLEKILPLFPFQLQALISSYDDLVSSHHELKEMTREMISSAAFAQKNHR